MDGWVDSAFAQNPQNTIRDGQSCFTDTCTSKTTIKHTLHTTNYSKFHCLPSAVHAHSDNVATPTARHAKHRPLHRVQILDAAKFRIFLRLQLSALTVGHNTLRIINRQGINLKSIQISHRFPGGLLVCSRPSEREIVGSNPGRD